jgi:lysophospholipase L1-like esterase
MLRPLRCASLAALVLTACTVDDAGSGSGTDAATSSGGSSSGGPGTTDDPTGVSGLVSESVGSTDAPTTADPTTTPEPSSTGPDPSTTAPDPSSTGPDTGDTTTGDDTTTGGGALDCLFEPFVNQGSLMIDYEQFAPVVGSHCVGTNHQDITDIERVVFLGDSVTVGTPPTGPAEVYRARLADALVERFGLMPPGFLWDLYDVQNGTAVQQDSGDFSSCSKWGARTDDFMASNTQIMDCFPPDKFDQRTLVVITMGGNDLAAIAKDGANGKPLGEVMADAEQFIQYMRDAVHWFVDDPNKFPNGVFVMFANVYEFTDGTGDVTSCPAAGLGGFDKPWDNPDDLKALMIWINEQYMDIAVETQTDMIFMLENFCGHGFKADDPTAPCYRGPDSPNYFDLTCIHPTPDGHGVISDMFTAVVDE